MIIVHVVASCREVANTGSSTQERTKHARDNPMPLCWACHSCHGRLSDDIWRAGGVETRILVNWKVKMSLGSKFRLGLYFGDLYMHCISLYHIVSH